MKIILFNKEARQKLLSGVMTMYNAVKATMGAGGRNVMIGSDWQGAPHITKDGVTVARAVAMNDPVEEMGARVIREAANKTASDAGDGTTTSTVLAANMIIAGIAAIDKNPKLNVVEMKKGMEWACHKAVSVIKSLATKVAAGTDDLFRIAKISANGDEYIAQVVDQAMRQIGKDGVISVQKSGKNSYEIDIELAQGMEFSQGICATSLFNDSAQTNCMLEDCYVLVVDGDIVKFDEVIGVLRAIASDNQVYAGKREPRGLLIIAKDVQGEAIATLVVNKMRNNLKVCAVRSPGFGDYAKELLQDIATVCGATVVNEKNGLTLKNVPLSALGLLKRVTAYKDRTIIVSSDEQKVHIEARCAMLQGQVEAAKESGEKEALALRHAKLSNGVAVMYVGGFTEVEMNERRDRLDDAICAARSALEEGYVAGGGIIYLQCVDQPHEYGPGSKSFRQGQEIVANALRHPFSIITRNAGLNISVEKAIKWPYPTGINAVNGEMRNLIESGIIDPAKVCRVSIENAVSVAATLLTTECVISPTIAKLPEK